MRNLVAPVAVSVLLAGCGLPRPTLPPAHPGSRPDLVTLQSMLPSVRLGMNRDQVHEMLGLPDDRPSGDQERYFSSAVVGGRPVALVLTYGGDGLRSVTLGPSEGPAAPEGPESPAPSPR